MTEHFAASNSGSRVWLLILCLVFAVLVWPVIALPAARRGTANGDAPFPVAQMGDQMRWHEPVVRRFAAQFPRFDFSDYESTAAPGYYVVMATVAQVVDSRFVLQAFNGLFGLALIALVWRLVEPCAGRLAAAALALPLVASPYVISTSIWLSTDNLALVFVTGALGLLTLRPPTFGNLLIGIALATAAVFVRQVHLWVIAPALLVILLSVAWIPRGYANRVLGEPSAALSWPRVLSLSLAALAPFAVVGWLVVMWAGLTPPDARLELLHEQGMNAAAFPYALALIGTFGVFFAPVIPGRGRDWLRVDRLAIIIVVLAVLVCVVQPTTHDEEAGRRSGWMWGAVRVADAISIADRSLVVLALGSFGAWFLLRAWRAARDAGHQRAATLLLLSLVGWVFAQSMNSQVWQRYYEPLILVALAILTALGWKRGSLRAIHPARLIPLAALTLLQLVMTVLRIYLPLLKYA